MAGSSPQHIDAADPDARTGEGSPAAGTTVAPPRGGVTDRRARMAGTVAAVGAVVAGWLWWGQPAPVGDPADPAGAAVVASPTGAPAVTVAATTIMVHVSGAVLRPGLVSVAPGARVADAIAAAGGASRSADVAGVNLAAPVVDGEHITVPAIGAPAPVGEQEHPGGDPAQPGSVTGAAISLNTATAVDLEGLPGVGPVIAGQIIAHREAHGPFQAVEDLLDVPGIGEAKLAAIRDLVTVP